MENKIDRRLLLNEKGFAWHIRYSETDQTDKFARWARVAYFNGFCIGWINGFVKGWHDKLDNERIGKVDFFTTSLYFPINSGQASASGKFYSFEEAKKYTEEMFLDFRELISDSINCPMCGYDEEE